jgi:CRISPR/Cas system-associated exonuclease Cas4 (RecB family)
MYLTGIHRGILLYENKNTQEIKIFEVGYDKGLVAQLLERINYINWCYKNRKLPRREGKPSDSKCKNCEFRVACINNILMDGVTEDLE